VERPGATQQVAELLLTNPMGFGIRDLLHENVGHGADRYVPFVGSISIFILFSNLLGLFPRLAAPTGVVAVPLGCAILTFLYFNMHGIRHHGVGGYLSTFAGSPKKIGDWILALLLFPVEIISTSARILSLTVRLWANMFASDLIYGIFLSLLAGGAVFGWSKSPVLGAILSIFPALIPVAFLGLHIFVSVVQAYVFTVLPAVYLGLATADEH
jgi:F-type H+-transporting ATPase subunit a